MSQLFLLASGIQRHCFFVDSTRLDSYIVPYYLSYPPTRIQMSLCKKWLNPNLKTIIDHANGMMHVISHALLAYFQLSNQILIIFHQNRYLGIARCHERGEWVGISGGDGGQFIRWWDLGLCGGDSGSASWLCGVRLAG